MVSSEEEPQVVARARALGVADYVVKSGFSAPQFVEAVHRYASGSAT